MLTNGVPLSRRTTGFKPIAAASRRVYRTGAVADHPFVAVGSGEPPLVLIPGLNDPLMPVTGSRPFSLGMASYLRRYAGDRAVYAVSRPPGLPSDVTMADLAEGYADVLRELGRADLLGLSMGGFAVLELAARRPDLVRSGVLGLAAHSLSAAGAGRVRRWRTWAETGHWTNVYDDAARVLSRRAPGTALRIAGRAYDAIGREPVCGEDFVPSADACLAYDGRERLADVAAPLLVIGGTADPFFAPAAFRETAERVPRAAHATLYDVGHEAVVDHAAVFESLVREFFAEVA